MKSLEEILEGDDTAPVTEPAPTTEPDPAPEAIKADDPATDPEAEPAKPAEAAADEPAGAEETPKGEEGTGEPPSSQGNSIPIAAHLAEREKRQEAERTAKEVMGELEQLRAQIAQMSQPPVEPPKRPDPYDDPEGARQFDEQQVEAKLINQKVNMSAEIARQSLPDFDEVMKDWHALRQSDPMLHQSLFQVAIRQNSPAMWAYNKMVETRVAREIGNPEEYRAKVEAEVRAKVEAELQEKQAANQQQAANGSIPQSLAGVQSSGAPRGKAWSGPTPMDEILG